MAGAALLAGFSTDPAQAVGDGARAYLLVPEGSGIGAVNGVFLDGNASLDPATAGQARLSLDVVAFQFTQTVRTAGTATGLFVLVPVGHVKGSVTLDQPGQPPIAVSGRSRGMGDIQLGAIFGLAGSPSLKPEQYGRHRPGFSLGAIVKVTAPTGQYRQSEAVNLGANRWAVAAGLPVGFGIGHSLLDPKLMTIDLLPSVTLFTANDAPLGALRKVQAPLMRLEGHVTRNLGRNLWVSLDSVYTRGGATTTDGRPEDNAQSSLELGGSLGLALPGGVALKANYGRVVARNANGLDGSGFRFAVSRLF